MPRSARDAFEVGAAVLHAFDTSDQITRYLVEHVDDAAWRAAPPGGKGRTIAAIVAHVHAVRGMWVKAASGAAPTPLDAAQATRAEALDALGESHAALRATVAAALAGDGRIAGFKPDVVGFIGYFVAHEAHHRGQIAMLARQTGHPLPKEVGFGMWAWGTRGAAVSAPGAA
ncbi:MAG TPA: DinB family protein [Gemmatirosa sp.]